MAVPTRKAKPSTVSHAVPRPQTATPAFLLDQLPCCKDLNDWPRRWMGFPEDIPPGEKIVECFRPFLHHLVQLQLAPKTILETPSLRKKPISSLVFDAVRDGGLL